ncbi:MAG: DUF1844 domain-containing protein [Chthoniobacterales bacterium]
MAEVQQNTNIGEMTKRFIEFVMMQAQQISLFLGKLKHPQGETMEPNLELAKLFIDQLEMIREKTRGNLSKEEDQILNNILSDLQLAYVEVAKELGAPVAAAPAEVADQSKPEAPSASEEEEAKKRFTKSYG